MKEERGTVDRVVRLLRYLASSSEPARISEVADVLGLPRSTVHRLMGQFVEHGLLKRARGSREYEVGKEMFRLGALMSRQVNIVELGTRPMERIVKESGESCSIGLYREADATMFFAASVETAEPLRYHVELFKPESVLWGASRRAILAHLPRELLVSLLKKNPRSPTGLRPLKLSVLEEELARIRRQGYSVTQRGERVKYASGISAPIFGAYGRVVGCLSLTIPAPRWSSRAEVKLAALMTREAAVLSRDLSQFVASISTIAPRE